jgi:hypothetical protein
MKNQDYLNSELKAGKIKITNNRLFSQDFETTDGAISVKGDRLGGGFTSGRNIYRIDFKGGKITVCSLAKVYDFVAAYLQGTDLSIFDWTETA